MPEHLNIDQLMGELATLAGITDAEPPAVTRIVFSEADQRARTYVKQLCTAAGLAIREDAVGNTFARWLGTSPDLPPVATGSHIDAIPNAGAYDGTVGILGGLEAIRQLQRSGHRPQRSIDLILFTSEEPTRFGIGCLGSRLMSGALSPQLARQLRDTQGLSLDELRTAAGFSGSLESVQLPYGSYHAFVELHIEQGPILEQKGIDVGVVTHIAAPASVRIFIEGVGGHAGAVLMPDRHDALAAAAELILALETAACSTGSIDSVATVGICDVFPGAVNSVPSHVRLEADIRDTDAARRDAIVAELTSSATSVAERRGVLVRLETVNADPPASCAAAIVEIADAAVSTLALQSLRMVSRAYHDSLFMARIAPIGMIFIPCRKGVSHRPDEYASRASIAAGVAVLVTVLKTLAASS